MSECQRCGMRNDDWFLCRDQICLQKPQKALDDIAVERRRQIEVEGWTPEHDDRHFDGSLARAAACYVLGDIHNRRTLWLWDLKWWKPDGRRRNLVKAGALIIAEIERLDRAAQPAPHGAKEKA